MSTEAFISARLPSVNNTTSLPSGSPALANQPGTHASSMDVDAHMHEHEASAVVNIQPDWYLVLREEEGKGVPSATAQKTSQRQGARGAA